MVDDNSIVNHTTVSFSVRFNDSECFLNIKINNGLTVMYKSEKSISRTIGYSRIDIFSEKLASA
jgi:hypothetical protein